MTSGGMLFGADARPTDPALRRLVSALESSPVGNNLLLGSFVLPFATDETDPTWQTNVPNGLSLLYVKAGTLHLTTYSRALKAWKTLVYS